MEIHQAEAEASDGDTEIFTGWSMFYFFYFFALSLSHTTSNVSFYSTPKFKSVTLRLIVLLNRWGSS